MRAVYFLHNIFNSLNLIIFLFIANGANAMIGGSRINVRSAVFINDNFCSGTLISKNIILTAGHCITKNISKKPSLSKDDIISIVSYEGGDYNLGLQKFHVKVLVAEAHPTWISALNNKMSPDSAADDENTYDVGIIVLDQNLPISIAKLPQADESISDSALVTGSGCTAYNGSPSFFSKAAWINVTQFSRTRIEIGTVDKKTGLEVGLCKGDSGGGLFQVNQVGDQNLTVIGVNSTQLGVPGKINPGIAVDLRNTSVLEWLEKQGKTKVITTATDILPQSFDDDLKKYTGTADPLPSTIFRQIMRISLKDPDLSCYNRESDFGELDSPELILFVRVLTSSASKNKTPTQVKNELLKSKEITSCAN